MSRSTFLPARPRRHGRAATRGVSLIFALLALAAMSLAAVALLRSVDTSALIVGNLGLRQDSVAASSRAAERAIEWLNLNAGTATLHGDNGEQGYYATANVLLDPTDTSTDAARSVVGWPEDPSCGSFDRPFATCLSAGPNMDENGHRTSYVITRLCTAEGSPTDAANSCARGLSDSLTEGGEKGDINYNRQRGSVSSEAGPYYRIVVRTAGPRNTVSYTETIVHF